MVDRAEVRRQLIRGLERYIANPPTTDAGWNAYQKFVKEIITTVYSVIGGEA